MALRSRGIGTIHVLNRTRANADALVGEIEGPFAAHGLRPLQCWPLSTALVVNTTSIGMHCTRFSDHSALLPSSALVTDIVYVPLVTPLLADAAARGLKTVDGLGMLLHQAVPGFKAWFGTEPKRHPGPAAAHRSDPGALSMLRLGITGSIATGKSTVLEAFKNLGVPVFSAHEAVADLYAGQAVAPVEALFPGVAANGVIDKAKLSAALAAEPSGFKRLEAVVHPLVATASPVSWTTRRAAGPRSPWWKFHCCSRAAMIMASTRLG